MPRTTHRLTAIKVAALKTPGLHADGDGLYLRITDGGTKSWIWRYWVNGKARDMGLGPQSTVSLARARELAAECRLASVVPAIRGGEVRIQVLVLSSRSAASR